MAQVKIGTWIERESREITRCPSYYAADHETLKTEPGEYDLFVTFEGGFMIPMPKWLLVAIPADRISGALYSGFGGVNFASTPLPKERTTYHIQTYQYVLPELVKAGTVRVDEKFSWLIAGAGEAPWNHEDAPKTWDDVKKLVA